MSVEFKESYPLSLFKKSVKNDSQMPLPIMKDIFSKLRIFVKYIAMLATFSCTFVLLFYYDDYYCHVLKLFIFNFRWFPV